MSPLSRILHTHQVILLCDFFKLELHEAVGVGLEVGEEDLAHGVDVLVTYLTGGLPLVGHEELVEELVLQHCILRNLVVGHGLAEQAHLLQKVVADLPNGLDLEFFQNVSHILTRPGVFERLLLDK